VQISRTCKIGQKLGVSLPLLTCSLSAWPSRLLYRMGRKSRRDLWVTLYYMNRHFFYKNRPDDGLVRVKLVANIWNNKIRKLWQTEYVYYFILILYFKHNGMSCTYNKWICSHLQCCTNRRINKHWLNKYKCMMLRKHVHAILYRKSVWPSTVLQNPSLRHRPGFARSTVQNHSLRIQH
jgi:hypothetical protein